MSISTQCEPAKRTSTSGLASGIGQAWDGRSVWTRKNVKGRIKALRDYRWSSYRAYIGLERVPEWLCCDRVLGLMGGKKSERPRAYQRLVEAALLEGMESQ